MDLLSWSNVWTALKAVWVVIGLWFASFTYRNLIRPRWYARSIPGPKRDSHFLLGHVVGLFQSFTIPWHREFGSVIRFKGPFGSTYISTDDKKALQYILIDNAYRFPKPWVMQKYLAAVSGEAILSVEGDVHRRQRNVMNPSFGTAQMKQIFPVFQDKAAKLCDLLNNNIHASSDGKAELNFHGIANQTTLEIIASAGFDHETDAMNGDSDDLVRSFNLLFGGKLKPSIKHPLVGVFPWMKHVVNMKDESGKLFSEGTSAITRIGKNLIQQKKDAVRNSFQGSNDRAGRDVLSSLVKANMASDLKPNQRMSDEEILAQVRIILLAGFDTTANSLCWTIYELCQHPAKQAKLREEILQAGQRPSHDELHALPYLDAFIRETWRIHGPVPGMNRVASEDTFIPLSKPFVDQAGKKHDRLFIAKHTAIYIPIIHMNRDPERWGPDAEEFRPERWIDDKDTLPEGVREIPSVAFPTFLAGPRACIGFRFSTLELKTLVFALVGGLDFELIVPGDQIVNEVSTLVLRPQIKGQPQVFTIDVWHLRRRMSRLGDYRRYVINQCL